MKKIKDEEYYNLRKKKHLIRQKEYNKKHPNYQREYMKQQYLKKGVEYREKMKNYQRNLRIAVIEALGGKCIECGFNDIRALQIDHINGGGSQERKEGKTAGQYSKHVMESFLKKENKYQLLCANCNWVKRVENNEIGRAFIK